MHRISWTRLNAHIHATWMNRSRCFSFSFVIKHTYIRSLVVWRLVVKQKSSIAKRGACVRRCMKTKQTTNSMQNTKSRVGKHTHTLTYLSSRFSWGEKNVCCLCVCVVHKSNNNSYESKTVKTRTDIRINLREHTDKIIRHVGGCNSNENRFVKVAAY